MIKKTFLTLPLVGMTFCLSIPTFAIYSEEDPALKEQSRTKRCGSGFKYTGNIFAMYPYPDPMMWLMPLSPEQLKLYQEEITNLAQQRSSLDPFQEIEGKNKVELFTLLTALDEQSKIEYQIDMLIRKIPINEPLFLHLADSSNLAHFEQRKKAVSESDDRLSLIAQRIKKIIERLEPLIKSSDE